MFPNLYPGCVLQVQTDVTMFDGRLCCFCYDTTDVLYLLTAGHILPVGDAKLGTVNMVSTSSFDQLATPGTNYTGLILRCNLDVALLRVTPDIKRQLTEENFCLGGALARGGFQAAPYTTLTNGQTISAEVSTGTEQVNVGTVVNNSFDVAPTRKIRPSDSGTCLYVTTTGQNSVAGLVSYSSDPADPPANIICVDLTSAFADLHSFNSRGFAIAPWVSGAPYLR